MQRSPAVRTRVSGLVAVAVAVAIELGRVQPALADDTASAARISGLTRKALKDYEDLDFDSARRRLARALEECTGLGLTQHPVAAEANLLMGVVILAGGEKDRGEAIAHLRKALEIQPDIQVPESVATPEIQKAFTEAATQARADKVQPAAADKPEAEEQPSRSPIADKGARAAAANAPSEVATSESEVSEPGDDRKGHSWFIAAGVGGGLGWTSGVGEVTDARVSSGFHPAALVHVLPEVGYFVSPRLLLSLQLRVQFVSGTTPEADPTQTMCGSDHVCSPSTGAMAVFAKATWFLESSSRVRPFLSGLVGGGQIRHRVDVPGPSTCGTDPAQPMGCVDTVAAGPVFVGPGGGIAVTLTPAFALLAGANALVGFSHFTFHVDLNAGAAVEF